MASRSALSRKKHALVGTTRKRNTPRTIKQKTVVEIELLPIDRLRPTKMAVGIRAVTCKRRKLELRATKRRPLKKIAQSRLIPAIRGPGREVFMIDNHHFALALWQASQHQVNVGILDDFSHLPPALFWQQMEANGWLYSYDEQSCRIDPSRLPLGSTHSVMTRSAIWHGKCARQVALQRSVSLMRSSSGRITSADTFPCRKSAATIAKPSRKRSHFAHQITRTVFQAFVAALLPEQYWLPE